MPKRTLYFSFAALVATGVTLAASSAQRPLATSQSEAIGIAKRFYPQALQGYGPPTAVRVTSAYLRDNLISVKSSQQRDIWLVKLPSRGSPTGAGTGVAASTLDVVVNIATRQIVEVYHSG